jgi:electron transport complex protein RnfC
MNRTFARGTHPPARKFTRGDSLADFAAPKTLYISLAQHIGAPATPVVNAGDKVKEGQIIALAAANRLSAHVFSSVSGTVVGIKKLPAANGTACDHIEIENDFSYEKQFFEPLGDLSAQSVSARIKQAGIVGMGGAAFPAHVKFSPVKPVDTLIINAAECEPYITCDYRLLLDETETFAYGVRLIMTVLGVKKAFVGVEANNREAYELLCEKFSADKSVVPVKLKTKYPQGAERQLVYALTRRTVPAGGLPSDVGCVVANAHTAFSVARAVLLGEPLYRRAVTVSGEGVETKGNFWVRTGVPFSFIYEKCRGAVNADSVKKVISGGPMMGFAQADLRPSIAKGTSSVLFLTDKEISLSAPSSCIACGRCGFNCPMRLLPRNIERAVETNRFEEAFRLGVASCIECGVCSYSCPAKRPLVQAVRLAKKEIKARGIK